jgi:hypothetical protein
MEYSMKRKLCFNLLLAVVGMLMFGGCSQDDESNDPKTGKPVEIQFIVSGISDYDDTSAETRGSSAESFTVSVPMNDDYEIEATFAPRNTAQTRGTGSALAENTYYRVMAYQGGTVYSGYADYKIVGGKSELQGGGLSLVSGQYKFVAYSYNNSDAISEAPDESDDIDKVTVNVDDDFLYWRSEQLTVSENIALSVSFRHLFPQLEVTLDATEFGSDFTNVKAAITVNDGGALAKEAEWTVLSENDVVDNYSTSVVESTADNLKFESISGQKITSNAKRFMLLNQVDGSVGLYLKVASTFANGAKSDKSLWIATANKLKANTAYTCTVKYSLRDIHMEESDGLQYPYGGGNCWVIPLDYSRERMYSFPAYEGRTQNKPGTTVNGGYTRDIAKVVWSYDYFGGECADLIKDLTYDSGTNRVRFKVGSGKEGNALIAVYNRSSNVILWSWHIWVVGDSRKILSTPIVLSNGARLMDRNLGAYANTNTEYYSLYYQWGRKDPLMVGGLTSVDQGAQPIVWTIMHPTGFPAADIWYRDGNLSLWNDDPTSLDMLKYNPCPRGWTLGSSSDYSLSYTSIDFENGRFLGEDGSGTYFPFTGYMNASDGVLTDYKERGYAWVYSSPDWGGRVVSFRFDKGGPSTTPTSLGRGLPVRCVQE